jgi:16S rRNA (uracil1498-N3)-methyltransferase
MSLSHFYLSADVWDRQLLADPNSLSLTDDEARHCSQVQRHRVGDSIAIIDGRGRMATAVIASISRNEVRLAEVKTELSIKPTSELVLLQALTKGTTFELILEKAVELGATRILPVISERSIVRLDAGEAIKKHAKWQRLIIESGKQCRQPRFPELALPCSLSAALGQITAPLLPLVASLEPAAKSLPGLLTAVPSFSGFAVAIGPEGDFSPEEYAALRQAGWHSWCMGPLTLRSETAAICALSILGYGWHP